MPASPYTVCGPLRHAVPPRARWGNLYDGSARLEQDIGWACVKDTVADVMLKDARVPHADELCLVLTHVDAFDHGREFCLSVRIDDNTYNG